MRFVTMRKTMRVCLLPFCNAIVLGSIVGMHFVHVDQQNNNQGEYYLESGHFDSAYAMQMFSAVLVVIAPIVFVVEITVHGIVHWLRARYSME
jgi:hypothetical protein